MVYIYWISGAVGIISFLIYLYFRGGGGGGGDIYIPKYGGDWDGDCGSSE